MSCIDERLLSLSGCLLIVSHYCQNREKCKMGEQHQEDNLSNVHIDKVKERQRIYIISI